MRTLAVSLSVILAGCTDSNLLASPEDAKSTSDSGDAAGDADSAESTDSGEEDTFVAAWVTFHAEASVFEGVGVPESASAAFTLADAALQPEECATLAMDGVVVAAPAERPSAMYAWWTLNPLADDGCSSADVASAVSFGLGVLDPEVRARLGTVDLEEEADNLLGAWFSVDGADPFPFGYAQVSDPVQTDADIADGAYTLVPLLLVALPQE